MEIIGERGPAALSWAVLGAKLSHALQFHAGSRGVGPAALFGRLGSPKPPFGFSGALFGALGYQKGAQKPPFGFSGALFGALGCPKGPKKHLGGALGSAGEGAGEGASAL